MTGPQLKHWRTSHDLTLRDVAELLERDVNHTSLSRWETSPDEIPKWAEQKLLATTHIHLPLSDLHELLDLAREQGISFDDLLGDCIREHLARRRAAKASAPVSFASAESPQHHLRVAEASTGYTSPLTPPATAPGADPMRAALSAAARHHLAGQAPPASPSQPGTAHHRQPSQPPPPAPPSPQAKTIHAAASQALDDLSGSNASHQATASDGRPQA